MVVIVYFYGGMVVNSVIKGFVWLCGVVVLILIIFNGYVIGFIFIVFGFIFIGFSFMDLFFGYLFLVWCVNSIIGYVEIVVDFCELFYYDVFEEEVNFRVL